MSDKRLSRAGRIQEYNEVIFEEKLLTEARAPLTRAEVRNEANCVFLSGNKSQQRPLSLQKQARAPLEVRIVVSKACKSHEKLPM